MERFVSHTETETQRQVWKKEWWGDLGRWRKTEGNEKERECGWKWNRRCKRITRKCPPKKRDTMKERGRRGFGCESNCLAEKKKRARRRHGYLTDRRNIWEDGQKDEQWEGVINEQERSGEGRHSICPSIVEKEGKKERKTWIHNFSTFLLSSEKVKGHYFLTTTKIIPSKLNIRNETPLAWLDNKWSLFSWFTEGRFLAGHKNSEFPKGVPHGICGCFSCRRQLMFAVFALVWHLATGWY